MVRTTARLVHGPCKRVGEQGGRAGRTKAAQLLSEGIGLENIGAKVKVITKLPRNCWGHLLGLLALRGWLQRRRNLGLDFVTCGLWAQLQPYLY